MQLPAGAGRGHVQQTLFLFVGALFLELAQIGRDAALLAGAAFFDGLKCPQQKLQSPVQYALAPVEQAVGILIRAASQAGGQ